MLKKSSLSVHAVVVYTQVVQTKQDSYEAVVEEQRTRKRCYSKCSTERALIIITLAVPAPRQQI